MGSKQQAFRWGHTKKQTGLGLLGLLAAIGATACASLDQAFAPPPEQVQAAALSAWSGIKQAEQLSSDPA
ncbi:MAG: hypothetical protein AAFR72_10605, partial [Pseudomonadota bacterium]